MFRVLSSFCYMFFEKSFAVFFVVVVMFDTPFVFASFLSCSTSAVCLGACRVFVGFATAGFRVYGA